MWEAALHGFENFSFHLLNRSGGNPRYTISFAAGDFTEALMNAPKESSIFTLKPSLRRLRALIAVTRPCHACVQLRLEKQRQIGPQIMAKRPVQITDNLRSKLAAEALIGFS